MNSENYVRSFFGDYYRGAGFYTLFHYAALFAVTILFFQKKHLPLYEKILAGTASLLAILSFWQFFGAEDGAFYGRPTGTLGNPMYLGQLFVIIFPLLLQAFLKSTSKLIWGFILFVTAAALFLTAARGAIIGLLFSMFIFGLLYYKKFHAKKIRLYFAIVMMLFILGFSSLILLRNQAWISENPVLRRMTFEHYDSIQPLRTRIDIWKGSTELIKNHFAFGVGQDMFGEVFQKYASGGLKNYPEQYADRAHNIELDLFATYGVFGFISYLLFFGALFLFVFKEFKRTKGKKEALTFLGFFASFAGIFIALQFNFLTLVHHVYFWILLGMLLRYSAKKERIVHWSLSPKMQFFLTMIFTIFVGFNLYLGISVSR